jgi:hypothetical protein
MELAMHQLLTELISNCNNSNNNNNNNNLEAKIDTVISTGHDVIPVETPLPILSCRN